jgi:hypothetical protein
MLGRVLRSCSVRSELVDSRLYDQDSFYPAFLSDLKHCKSEVIIESPFMTVRRISSLMPTLRKLSQRGVKIVINTRDPREHDERMCNEATKCVEVLQEIGVTILFTGGHHRKLAILDRRMLYEGSLNILSQNESCEIVRRIDSVKITNETLRFIDLGRYI